ncbi:MAG: NADH-quinone oxidoreductase subunit N [Chthoniobacterales bacterium]|nr:NADH-quinone oxidoreductase subunit N [Chthoniobacterales bacterium]
MNYLELVRLALPEIILTVSALAVLAIGLVNNRVPGFCSGLAAAGLLFAAAAVLQLPPQAVLSQGMLVVSPLNSLFQIVCLALAFFTVIVARPERLANSGEYLALVLLATVGLLLLIGSEELLMIFIGLELTGLSLYVLTAFDRTNQQSAEAGLKYFLFGSVASAFTLFGISLLYGLTKTTTLSAIGPQLAGHPLPPLLLVGIIMTLFGFAFKVAAAPFHLWAPDTYQGAPVSAAAFIASGSKVASFVVLAKILRTALHEVPGSAAWHALAGGWSPVLAALAALSIIVGNFTALAQRNVRRLLAYSAVAHAGYTLLGLIAHSTEGFSATLFYTTIYGLTLVGAFGVVAFVRRENGGDDLADFAGLSQRSPLLAGCMAIFILSLAGLPPLAGFFGKFYLFSAAFRAAPDQGLLWLVALALFGSLISLYYYLIILKAIFLDDSNTSGFAFRPDFLQRITLTVFAGAVLFLGVAPEALVNRILACLV